MRLAAGLAAALLLTGFSTALAAPGPPEAVRAAVRTEIDAVLSSPEPDEPAWIRTPTAAMFRRVDINDDGVADWRIDYEKAPNPSYFCGTGGCRQQIWVSNAAGGYDLAFNLTVRTFRLHRKDGGVVLDVDFHGSTCNGFGVDECPRGYGWAKADRRFVERAGLIQFFEECSRQLRAFLEFLQPGLKIELRLVELSDDFFKSLERFFVLDLMRLWHRHPGWSGRYPSRGWR